MPDEKLQLATLTMSCPTAHHTLRCVQFASCRMDGEDVMALVSVAGPQTAVKSFAAALNENVKLKCTVQGVTVQSGPDDTPEEASAYVDYIHAPGQGKYRCDMHRLPYNAIHCTARLKSELLLPTLSETTLWQRLNTSRFTTPLLKSWVPWIMREMLDEWYLQYLPAFQCSPGILGLSSEQLDAIVSRGVACGSLPIRKECSTTCNS